VQSAIAAFIGEPIVGSVLLSVCTQVVAGLNMKLTALVDTAAAAGKGVVVTLFKPLPHTGLPLQVKAVEAA
jgi:hypothetical protein